MRTSEKYLNILELVEKIRKGDEYVFRDLFVEYYQSMVNISFRYVEDKQIAENIVSDVFLNIWLRRKKLNVTNSIEGYLFNAARNGSLNYLKHLKIHNNKIKVLEERITISRTPHEDVVLQEFTQEIKSAIEDLPERSGRVFKMHRFDNLKYSEIAEILNISTGTVETHMVRALRFLRKRLSHLLPISTAN